ncbi:MAG: 30S ribosomal protein S12 methylthiotransferase RimO [Planctomycetes bacterium]|nr:30S ribosomal protein S12 methylthiotransferase RimO [Planctomycetota bacterium]MCB9890464.1 30S ribosomal protein S12 methylthiotransferase RimO [Planctomycetota bacterium]MCB9917705.1 30S ribosomal protein S12 methylthiotransferase RimO [Planctomycetota bacterium]
MSEPVRVSMISLGCPKNLVDSEVLLGHAARDGLLITQNVEDSDVAVINTCGFIDSAKEESIDTILEVAELKKQGKLRGIVVVGCLSQRYGDDLRKELPEVDAILGLSDYSKVPQLLRHIARGGDERFVASTQGGSLKDARSDTSRLVLTPKSYAYLRIGEGCDHVCTFCAIPSIRGKQRSKPIEVLVEEARGLASGGVKELVLVAEDSTAYGMDWSGRQRRLADLLVALGEVDGIEWIRVLYAYPHTVSSKITEQLRDNPKVVPYIDIPIQHISGPMLRAMKRGVSSEQVRGILDRLRSEVPGIAVRSTFIVGFPGETQSDFEELLALTEDYRFERLGVFPYSDEEGTPAHTIEAERVTEEVMEERVEAIMLASRRIIEERNLALVGQRAKVLVDGAVDPRALEDRPDLATARSIGRTFADAPEIDCSVFLTSEHPSGTFVEATIRAVDGYDLVAHVDAS